MNKKLVSVAQGLAMVHHFHDCLVLKAMSSAGVARFQQVKLLSARYYYYL